MDLSGMEGKQQAVAIDIRQPYHEIELGRLKANEQSWQTPYPSDWIIAVGFEDKYAAK